MRNWLQSELFVPSMTKKNRTHKKAAEQSEANKPVLFLQGVQDVA